MADSVAALESSGLSGIYEQSAEFRDISYAVLARKSRVIHTFGTLSAILLHQLLNLTLRNTLGWPPTTPDSLQATSDNLPTTPDMRSKRQRGNSFIRSG